VLLFHCAFACCESHCASKGTGYLYNASVQTSDADKANVLAVQYSAQIRAMFVQCGLALKLIPANAAPVLSGRAGWPFWQAS
jgi:hypothetical protein